MRVGILRALLYWRYYPLWEAFFKELGIQLFISPPTNKKIADAGLKIPPQDMCFPIKVGIGHIIELIELNKTNNLDYIFIPYLISIERDGYMCPKFAGFTDVARWNIENLLPILAPCLNVKAKRGINFDDAVYLHFMEVGKELGINNRRKIKSATKTALHYQTYTTERLHKERIMPPWAFSDFINNNINNNKKAGLVIGLIGHPYNIYDAFINRNIIEKLRNHEAVVITTEMIDVELAQKALISKVEKNIYWSFGREIVAVAYFMIENRLVDGIIYLISFGCAIDSLLQELVNFKAKLHSMPYMQLVIDEHSSELGILTRIEAFVDMIIKQKKM